MPNSTRPAHTGTTMRTMGTKAVICGIETIFHRISETTSIMPATPIKSSSSGRNEGAVNGNWGDRLVVIA